MAEIKTGIKNTVRAKVDKSLLASSMGSGSLDVYATPAAAALMERAAAELVGQYLDGGITTVGTMLSIEHISATPLGAEVTAEAVLVGVDGRKYSFEISAYDSSGLIARGRHERFSVRAEDFMKKTNSKFTTRKDS